MFNNRELRIKLDKTKKDKSATSDESPILDQDSVNLISEKGKDLVRYIALAAVGAYTAIKVVDTISQIAVKKTKSADHQ